MFFFYWSAVFQVILRVWQRSVQLRTLASVECVTNSIALGKNWKVTIKTRTTHSRLGWNMRAHKQIDGMAADFVYAAVWTVCEHCSQYRITSLLVLSTKYSWDILDFSKWLSRTRPDLKLVGRPHKYCFNFRRNMTLFQQSEICGTINSNARGNPPKSHLFLLPAPTM